MKIYELYRIGIPECTGTISYHKTLDGVAEAKIKYIENMDANEKSLYGVDFDIRISIINVEE